MRDISISDWVLILTTLFLGATAVLTPAVGGSIKRWWLEPKLRIDYAPRPPGAHKTRLDVRLSESQVDRRSAYYLRFAVTNTGRTQAHRCEAVLEELWHANSKGGLERFPTFGPTGLTWGAGYNEFVEINPSRLFFCDFISIPDPAAQLTLGRLNRYVNLPGPEFECGLVLCTRAAFYSQPNRLPPGKYRLKVAVFSENAAPARRSFDIDWSGEWKDDEALMFEECIIRAFAVAA
jgi:hypothetical protein